MDLIQKYFPNLSEKQLGNFAHLKSLYNYWNQRVNLISRKDIDHLFERHIVHSLAVNKMVQFETSCQILDVGTGGGFPGIPLAIVCPRTNFTLIDGTGKKIQVVNEIISELDLRNARGIQIRAEDHSGQYHYIVSRAVMKLPEFYNLVKKNMWPASPENNFGIYYLKGGSLVEELKPLPRDTQIKNISEYFKEPFFETKKIIFIPGK